MDLKDIKMDRRLSEKNILLCSDCQINTKAIRVILRPGPSGDLVLKSKLYPDSGSIVLRQLNSIHKKGPQFF